jgi:indolepyruvate ferredoxin oxidoreductase alpha subunit
VDALADELVAAGIRTFLGVPGYPVTELLEALDARDGTVLDAQNEKTAAEMAVGSSLAGTPTALVVKGNGALLAAEPLQNAGPHGIGAPLLLIVGDDVLADRSTVPTDARPLGPVLHLPVFDVPAGTSLRPTVSAAVEASRLAGRPVVLRLTGSLLTAPPAEHRPVGRIGPAPNRTWVDPSSATKLSRALEFSVTRADELRSVAEAAPRWERPGSGTRGVVAVGACGGMVDAAGPDVAVLAVTCVHPLPTRVLEFSRDLDEVLVVEEGTSFVEDELQRQLGRVGSRCRVLGQRSGALPALGATSPDAVAAALRGASVEAPSRRPRPPDADVDAHEFAPLFGALAEVHAATGAEVHSCVGSCISIAYPPYSLARSALNLGGATGVAAGAALADGRPCIALIGDYGLIHSGLDAHDQIQRRHLPVLTVVLANGRSAKTGGQPSAASASVPGQDPVDLPALVGRSGGPVVTVRLEGTPVSELRDVASRLLQDAPATLVVVSGDDVAGC